MNFEHDLVWMSLVIFAPSLFALILLFIPRGRDEAMRWCALFGTAITLVLSVCMFITYYYDVVEFNRSNEPGRGSLSARAGLADAAEAQAQPLGTAHSNWIARRPWIPHFGIDYYLGVDG